MVSSAAAEAHTVVAVRQGQVSSAPIVYLHDLDLARRQLAGELQPEWARLRESGDDRIPRGFASALVQPAVLVVLVVVVVVVVAASQRPLDGVQVCHRLRGGGGGAAGGGGGLARQCPTLIRGGGLPGLLSTMMVGRRSGAAVIATIIEGWLSLRLDGRAGVG
jgi:hypothetical protein